MRATARRASSGGWPAGGRAGGRTDGPALTTEPSKSRGVLRTEVDDARRAEAPDASTLELNASQREAVRGVLGHASLSEASKYTSFQVRGLRRRLGTFDLRASADGA